MSYHARRVLTPLGSRKRKERESVLAGTVEVVPATKLPAQPVLAQAPAKPVVDNSLLAGYMAYEFLTKGTLLGQRLDPAGPDEIPVGRPGPLAVVEPKRAKPQAEPSGKEERGSYADVASILKADETHIPGIVNPTQLARWIRR